MKSERSFPKIKDKFDSLLDIIMSRLLNGYVELAGISLTEQQFEEMKNVVKQNDLLRRVVQGYNMYNFTLVDSVEKSNLKN